MIRRYKDFEVVVTKRANQLYVDLGTAPSGRNLTRPIPVTLPADRAAWTEAKQGRKSEAELAELGCRLYKALITGELASNWDACLGEVNNQPDTGLRLRISHQAEALTDVPLELLCKRAEPVREFLALDALTPIVRSPRTGNPVGKQTITPPLRMLVIIANPKLEAPIDPGAVRACLERALGDLVQAGQLQVNYIGTADGPNADYDTIQRTLLQAKPSYHIVHFVCHGGLSDPYDKQCEGVLLLEDTQTGCGHPVRASDLAGLLAPNGVRVAVLQACDGARAGSYSAFQGVAQQLITKRLPAAVAMQCSVEMDVASYFCSRLYHFWLSESGLPIERAVTEARQAVRQRFGDQALGWWPPVLFIRQESTEVLRVELDGGPSTIIHGSRIRSTHTQAHLDALTRMPEYARWADRPHIRGKGDDHYIRTESKILPLFVVPFDDDTVGHQREDLLNVMRRSEHLLVLGEPGVGKTAALERMVWETAKTGGLDIPIYVPLSYYMGDLITEVREALEETGVLHFSTRADVDDFMRQNQCLVLFDGLNEVRGDQRQRIVGEIADFVRVYRRHRYVLTSRSQDRLWETLRGNSVLWRNAVVVQRVTDDQVREYLIAHLDLQKGGETHDRLNRPLRDMSRTPLFLWMLKEVRMEGGELPGNRGELFDRFVERAVFTRDEGKLEICLPRLTKKMALAHLALTMHSENRLTCREEEAVAIVSLIEAECDPEALIREAQVHGLLKKVERKGERQIRFMHQAMQEYFVALGLREEVENEVGNPVWQQLGRQVLRLGPVARASDSWWAESFVQLAGLTDHASWLAREVAKRNPWLAFWCMIEGRKIDEETRKVVESGTVALLHSDDVKERRRAVRELEKLENPRTAEYLVSALDDGDEGVVNLAVGALGKLGEPAAEYLHPHIDSDTGVRQASIEALGLIWQLPSLIDLGNADPNLRMAALKALEQLGDRRIVESVIAVARWDANLPVRRHAIELLGQLGDRRAVSLLVAILGDVEPSLRASAAMALGQIGHEQAVNPLTEVLNDKNEVVWRRATSALGRIWGMRDLEHLGDERVDVRLNAVIALAQLADVRTVQPFIASLRDKAGAVCARAATALGQLGDLRAVQPLISVLLTRVDHPAARSNAAEALGQLGDRQAVESLIAALKDKEQDVRRSAATALGQLADKRAVEHLINVCKDAYVKRSASEALARIGRSALPLLIDALKNEEGDVRASAAIVLGQIGGIQALEALLVSLRDADVKVRASAAVALGQLGDERATKALVRTLKEDKDRVVCASAAASLGQLGQLGGTQIVDALVSILIGRGEDEAVFRMAIRALGEIWSVTELVWLSDEDATVRQDAAMALGQLGDERAIEPLVATLRDPDEMVRRRSTSALGRIWRLSQLVQFDDDDPVVRQGVAEALGQLGDTRAVEPLIAALRDSSATVRFAATQALGQLNDGRAVQPLIEALDDDEIGVQEGAASALESLASLAVPGLISALKDAPWFTRRRVAEALGRIGEPRPLIEALQHHDRHVRRRAVEKLARMGGTRAVEPLVGALLRDTDSQVRRWAAEALGKSGDPRAVRPLIQALSEDQDWLVRWETAEAMGNMGDPSAVESLISTLQDAEWPVRWVAAKALGKIGDEQAVEPLIEALTGDWPALWTVAEALGQLKDERAVEPLVATLRNGDIDRYTQRAVVEALGRLGEPIQNPLIEVLLESDRGIRQRAIAALGQMGDARDLTPLVEALGSGQSYYVWQGAMEALVQIGEPAVKPLIDVLQDGDVFARRRAARALGQVGDPRAVEFLIAALSDKASSVRRQAAKALGHFDTPEARSAVRRYKKANPRE